MTAAVAFLFGIYLGGVLCTGPYVSMHHWFGKLTTAQLIYSTVLWPIAVSHHTWRLLTQYRALRDVAIGRISRQEVEQRLGIILSVCLYTVREGDDLEELCRRAGVDIALVDELNPGVSRAEYWQPGREVKLPRNLGIVLELHTAADETETK
jgi:hypothetical protein